VVVCNVCILDIKYVLASLCPNHNATHGCVSGFKRAALTVKLLNLPGGMNPVKTVCAKVVHIC